MRIPHGQRVLVVYFSRDGHTRRVAQEIAAACHADLKEIRSTDARGGPLGYLRCALEALLGVEPGLQRGAPLAGRHGLVAIGTPIWFWNIASPVRAWVVQHRADLPQVAFFCTCGGSGAPKVLDDLARLCGRQAVATLALTEAQCDDAQHLAQVRRFADDCARGAAASGAPSS